MFTRCLYILYITVDNVFFVVITFYYRLWKEIKQSYTCSSVIETSTKCKTKTIKLEYNSNIIHNMFIRKSVRFKNCVYTYTLNESRYFGIQTLLLPPPLMRDDPLGFEFCAIKIPFEFIFGKYSLEYYIHGNNFVRQHNHVLRLHFIRIQMWMYSHIKGVLNKDPLK